MKYIRYSYIGIIFLTFLIMLAGCKTSQKVGTVASGEAKAKNDFFESMTSKALQFQTLYARMNVELLAPGMEVKSRVDMKMVKDSAFQLSVQPLMGIEMFRVEINRDSIKIIDRMNRRYFAENYSNLKGQTPIEFNYNNLQSLFVNHIFYPGKNEITPEIYSLFQLNQEGSYPIIRAKDNMGLQYIFTADGEEKLLSTFISDNSEKFKLQWVYTNFRLTEGQPFPMLMDINAFVDGNSAGACKLHFSRVQLNIPVQVEGTIPARYQRISWEEAVKMLRPKKE